MIVSDYIINYIRRNERVTHIFAYAGGTDAPLLHSIHSTEGIEAIPARHEGNAALAAVGYALVAEKLGVAVSMSGPGATNMVTALADAWFDSVPVLFCTGQVTTGTYKFDNPARQMGYQETDIISIVKSIAKASELVCEKETVPLRLKKFIAKAKSGRQGPVWLDVPFDVLRQDISDIDLEKVVPLDAVPKASPELIKAFMRMVEVSRRPLIIAGGGVRTREAHELLFEFADTLQIPVVTSLMGKDAFPNDHPLYFGFIGAYGNRFANIVMANADLIIAIGSRLDSRQTGTPRHFARAAKKVHIDIDRNELNNNIVTELPIHSDLVHFLKEAVQAAGPGDASKYREWREYHQRVKKEFDVTKDFLGSEKNVNPKSFLQHLSLQNDRETVYLADVGNNQMFAAQALVVKKGQRFLTSGGLGTMGFAIPAAIGASFGAPGKPIIAIMGDGGFQMALQELQTIAQFNLPIKLVVLNNKILGLMKVFQDENYDGTYCATVIGYSVPNLEKIAGAFGFNYKRIDTDEEAASFIPQFLSERGPFLLEVTVNFDWTGYPKMRRGLGIEHQEPAISEARLREFMLIPTIAEK
jgi:acetolactate synthase I/II/III large subunit